MEVICGCLYFFLHFFVRDSGFIVYYWIWLSSAYFILMEVCGAQPVVFCGCSLKLLISCVISVILWFFTLFLNLWLVICGGTCNCLLLSYSIMSSIVSILPNFVSSILDSGLLLIGNWELLSSKHFETMLIKLLKLNPVIIDYPRSCFSTIILCVFWQMEKSRNKIMHVNYQ